MSKENILINLDMGELPESNLEKIGKISFRLLRGVVKKLKDFILSNRKGNKKKLSKTNLHIHSMKNQVVVLKYNLQLKLL